MSILMVMFTVYAYVLPYKEMLVNIIELFFQFNLLVFLLLRSTQSILDEYLRFPSHKHDGGSTSCSSENGMAHLTWILFPFAYLPLVVIIGIFSTKEIVKSWYEI